MMTTGLEAKIDKIAAAALIAIEGFEVTGGPDRKGAYVGTPPMHRTQGLPIRRITQK